MAALFLFDDVDKTVFNFSPESSGVWQISRISKFHHENGKDKFVLRQADAGSATRWVLEDQSSGKASIFGTPKEPGHGPSYQDHPSPPRGKWLVWGCSFTLTDEMPRYMPIESPCTTEVPFASMHYHEEGTVAHLELLMRDAPITDDSLEQALSEMRRVLINLARRPEMVLMIRSDARQTSSVPSWRQIKRFLSFIQQEVGTECVLVGRGSAIILVPSGFLGRALLGIVQFVQRILPAPYPQTIVSTVEEADKFLEELAVEARAISASLQASARSGESKLPANAEGQPAACAASSGAMPAPPPSPPQLPPAAPLSSSPRLADKEMDDASHKVPERSPEQADHLEGAPTPRPNSSWFCVC
eukprot:gb/GFBE01080048.1/.p1 GENE.gb/GFBE01080048.1/~~gb/GFBE01080048.1/.p1  ORF type:complete len:359 (+),score=59.39 gb/GFBE01080048.1/:1-1077(+)